MAAEGALVAQEAKRVKITNDSGVAANVDDDAADGATADALQDEVKQEINIVEAHGLMEYSGMTKGDFKVLIKAYFGKLTEKLAGNEAKAAAFKAHQKPLTEFIGKEVLPNFNEFSFYLPKNANTDDGCMIIMARFKGDADAPIFYYFVDGMKEEKC